jgi:hypothetical protein
MSKLEDDKKPNYPDIHIINGKYYNWNGKDPNKPLTKPYGKRLLSYQNRYGDIVDIKTASGHGKFIQKKKYYDEIIEKKDKKITKKLIKNIQKIESKKLLDDIRNRKVDTKNLRTRFRAGFRYYKDDDDDFYTSETYHKALNGVVSLERFLNELTDFCFQDNVRGGFKYVVYDKKTHKVHHSFEYGEQD